MAQIKMNVADNMGQRKMENEILGKRLPIQCTDFLLLLLLLALKTENFIGKVLI